MRKRHLFGLMLLALLLSACASSPKILPNEIAKTPKSVGKVTDISHLNIDQRSQLYYSILLAKLAEKKQLLDIAQSNFQDALDKTKSPELAGNSTQIALFQKDYPAAEKALFIWQQSEPNSIAPKQIALLIALHKQQQQKAYQHLLSIYPPNESQQASANPLSNNELESRLKQLLQLAFWKTPDVSGLESQLLGMANLLQKYNQEQKGSKYQAVTQTAEAFFTSEKSQSIKQTQTSTSFIG